MLEAGEDKIGIMYSLVDSIDQGVLILDEQAHVVFWNKFMVRHSGIRDDAAIGRPIYELFPYLSAEWFSLKLKSVRLLRNFSFVSWNQHAHLFRFRRKRTVVNEIDDDLMYQDCTFFPVTDQTSGEVLVCVLIQDVSEIAGYENRVRELEDMNRTLEQMSTHDALTGTYNRGYISRNLEQAVALSLRNGSPLSVALLDVDHFKHVNDTHGHLAGDEVLKTLSTGIRQCIRSSDTFGRYGGEEFLLTLPDTDENGARIIVERIRRVVENTPTVANGIEIRVTASFGIARFSADMKDYLGLIHAADTALYDAKTGGRNQAVLYTSADQSATED